MAEVQESLFDQESAPARFTLSETDLFKRLVQLETDKLTTAADISQLKKDAAYHEDDNPYGIDKDEIKLIAKAAQLEAKRDYEEKKVGALQVFAKYEELTNYND